jgi:1,2-dihydroxy-3-keto-5-methylthiopentene dioxygenase
MAIVTIPDLGEKIEHPDEVRAVLARHGVDYERAAPAADLPPVPSAEQVLAAYAERIAALKAAGGYVISDVIDVHPDTPGLSQMLDRFNSEHWHSEDEVRFIIEGRGVFHIHPEGQPVLAVEVGPGDLIRVPAGIHHWFDLCADRRIRAIRLFRDPAGWAPNYTHSGVDERFQPLCFGPAYLPAARLDG